MLTTAQQGDLDRLGDWRATPQQRTRDEQWKSRLQGLVAFVQRTGKLPRYRKYTTEREHTIGVWLHIQSQQRSRGELLLWRQRALDQAIPGWHSPE